MRRLEQPLCRGRLLLALPVRREGSGMEIVGLWLDSCDSRWCGLTAATHMQRQVLVAFCQGVSVSAAALVQPLNIQLHVIAKAIHSHHVTTNATRQVFAACQCTEQYSGFIVYTRIQVAAP